MRHNIDRTSVPFFLIREKNCKNRPSTLTTFYMDRSVVHINDVVDNRQSEPGCALLRAEKRVKDFREVFLRDTDPAVFKHDLYKRGNIGYCLLYTSDAADE